MTVSESNIDFIFDDTYQVIKYDDSPYYRELFLAQPESKGVDFIAASEKRFLLIEVKNCLGNEAGNRWRISPDNKKRSTAAPIDHDISGRDSFDIEVAKKTAMTIAALLGAYTAPKPKNKVNSCMPFAEAMCDPSVHEGSRKIIVVLVLDGSFGCQTRNDRIIRYEIQSSLKKKLKWLNAEVIVLDSSALREIRIGVSAVQHQ